MDNEKSIHERLEDLERRQAMVEIFVGMTPPNPPPTEEKGDTD